MSFQCDNLVIRDEYGRERLFKGFNCCIKDPQYLESSISDYEKQIPKMLQYGCNIIRLGIFWFIIEHL